MDTLEGVTLKNLSTGQDRRLDFIFERISIEYPPNKGPSRAELLTILWSFVAKGLVYVDPGRNSPENWYWSLTDHGKKSAEEKQFNPDDPEGYLSNFREKIPDIDDVVCNYVRESVYCYYHDCYMASAVMLGVASEAAILDMISSGKGWLEIPDDKFLLITSKKTMYSKKIEIFKKYFESKKHLLPDFMKNSYSLLFDSLLDLYRLTRNDAGHPTGIVIDRDDQYAALQMFGKYAQKIYKTKFFFNSQYV